MPPQGVIVRAKLYTHTDAPSKRIDLIFFLRNCASCACNLFTVCSCSSSDEANVYALEAFTQFLSPQRHRFVLQICDEKGQDVGLVCFSLIVLSSFPRLIPFSHARDRKGIQESCGWVGGTESCFVPFSELYLWKRRRNVCMCVGVSQTGFRCVVACMSGSVSGSVFVCIRVYLCVVLVRQQGECVLFKRGFTPSWHSTCTYRPAYLSRRCKPEKPSKRIW